MRQNGRLENSKNSDNVIRLDLGLRETEDAGIQHLQLIRGVWPQQNGDILVTFAQI
jgi:hypothetical protein